MATFLGKWRFSTADNVGDTVKTFEIEIPTSAGNGWGTDVGLGWTPTMPVRRVGGTAVVATLTGSWKNTPASPESVAQFQIGAASALVPALGSPAIRYESPVKMTKAGAVGFEDDPNEELFEFEVERWP